MEEEAEMEEKSLTIFKEAKLPVTLEFEDIVYKVKIKTGKGGWLCFKDSKADDQERVILKGIAGAVLPSEMLAMLGPSGSGKTTLLTALGGRLGGHHLAGTISFNGKPFSNIIKRSTGFVTQDDELYPHLTVAETLIFTALLRLPNTLSKERKIMQAKAVITQLGLTKCKNSIIGGTVTRGISGGERKRVSIGQELLINPSLLFLDEPTSGLDSTTAQQIVSTLLELVRGGRTVVTTIHQPSSRLFYMFHKVLLLSDGNPLYFGKGSDAVKYFSSIGYSPSVSMNPSDFLLDLANGVSDDSEGPVAVMQALVSAYKSNLDEKLKGEMQVMRNQVSDVVKDKDFGSWSTTWWQQFSVLLERGLKERRHENFSVLRIVQVLAVAVICGLLWWQSSHLPDQIGLLFFYSLFWGNYPVMMSIFTFPQERRMLTKERASGMYRLSSYFLARMASDLPMELALPTVFVTISYWMSGLKPNAGNFFETLFVLLFAVLASQGLGLAIGALVMNLRSAATLGGVLALTFAIAGGFYVAHVPVFIKWIQYISYSNHSYKLFLGAQYKPDDVYECAPNVSCRVDSIPTIKMAGLDNKAGSVAALATMLVVYRLIAYFGLTRIRVKH